ncbi:hypothetical protein ACSSS7_002049 [Eimeria intestinalis]
MLEDFESTSVATTGVWLKFKGRRKLSGSIQLVAPRRAAPECFIRGFFAWHKHTDLAPSYPGEPHYFVKLVLALLFLFCLESQRSLAFSGALERDPSYTDLEHAVGLASDAHLSDVTSHASAWASSADEASALSQSEANRSHLDASSMFKGGKPGQRKFHKKIALGALGLAAIVVLCLGRLLRHRRELAESGAEVQSEPFLYSLNALYAGNIDLQRAREAAKGWRVSSLERLEREAVDLLRFVDGYEAEAALSNLRNLIKEAKLEETRLQEALPVSATLTTPEATQVARTTQVRASVDRLRQHFDSALGEAHILHGLARRFLSDAENVSEIFLERIAACEETLQEVQQSAKKAVKYEDCFKVHLQRVRELAREAKKDVAAIQAARARVNAGAADLGNLSLAEPIDAIQIALQNVLRVQRLTSASWGWMEDAESALQVFAKNFVTEVSIHSAGQHNKLEQVRFFSETSHVFPPGDARIDKLAASSQRMQQHREQLRGLQQVLTTIKTSEEIMDHLTRAFELLQSLIANSWTPPLPSIKRGSLAAALKRASKQQQQTGEEKQQQQQMPCDQKQKHKQQQQQQEESSDEVQQHLSDQQRPRRRPKRRARKQQQQQLLDKQQPQPSAGGTQQQPAGEQQQHQLPGSVSDQPALLAEQQNPLRATHQPHSGGPQRQHTPSKQQPLPEKLSSEGNAVEYSETGSPTIEDLRNSLLSAASAAAEGVASATVGGSSWGTATSHALGEELQSLGFSGFHRSSDMLAEWLRQVEAADFAAAAMRNTIRQLQEAGAQTSIVAAADQAIELALVAAERTRAAARLAVEGKGWARLEEDLGSAIEVYWKMLKSPRAPPAAVVQAHHLTAEAFLNKASLVGRQRDLGIASHMACELIELERKLGKLVREHRAAVAQLQLQQLGPPLLQLSFEARKEEVLGLAKAAELLVSRAQRDVLLLVERADVWPGKVDLPEVSGAVLAVRNAELRVRDISSQLYAALGKLKKAATTAELGQAGFEVLRAKDEILALTRNAHFAYQKSMLALFRTGTFARMWEEGHIGLAAVRLGGGDADSLQEALSSAWQAVELREQLLTRVYVDLRKFPTGDPRIAHIESRLREEGAMVAALLQHLQGLVKRASVQGSTGNAGALPVLLAEAQSCAKSVWQLTLCVDTIIQDKQHSLDLVDKLVPDTYL